MVQMLVERGANTAAQDQVGASHIMALEVPLITKQVVHHHGLKLSDAYEASQLVYLLIPQNNLETEIVLACSFCIVFTCLYGLAYR